MHKLLDFVSREVKYLVNLERKKNHNILLVKCFASSSYLKKKPTSATFLFF